MDNKDTALGIVLVLVAIYMFHLKIYLLFIIIVIVGAYFLYKGIRSPSDRQIAKKTNSLIYTEILNKGLDKISKGAMNVSEDQFRSAMEKISWIFGGQSLMPQLGFDSLYLHFQKEFEAAEALQRLTDVGVKASIVQDKSDWQVMIEFK
ncbi:MAG: hypothetical protein ACYDAO_00010 [Thermoplasmataceae archaeon]